MTENLTTYTEVDPNSTITVSSSRVTVHGMRRNAYEYICKDFGAGYFNEIDISFAFYLASTSKAECAANVALSNNNEGRWLSPIVSFFIFRSRTQSNWEVYYRVGNNNAVLIYSGFSSDTVYYARMRRAASADKIYFYLYSDAYHNNLIASANDTIDAGWAFRYFYPVMSSNIGYGGAADFNGYFEKFDLGGNIASRNGVSWGSISKINGTAIGNISKINGVEV